MLHIATICNAVLPNALSTSCPLDPCPNTKFLPNYLPIYKLLRNTNAAALLLHSCRLMVLAEALGVLEAMLQGDAAQESYPRMHACCISIQ